MGPEQVKAAKFYKGDPLSFEDLPYQGMVTTSQLTHATPAAFGAHETNRGYYSDIGADYRNQSRPNILFGGGGNGLDAAATANSGYAVALDPADFGSLDPTAEHAGGTETDVVDQHDDDVRGPFRCVDGERRRRHCIARVEFGNRGIDGRLDRQNGSVKLAGSG